MRRRTLLAALGTGAASAAGCVGPLGETDAPPEADAPWKDGTTSDTPDTPDTPDDPISVEAPTSVLDLGTASLTLAMGPTGYITDDGEVVRSSFAATATADHPARVTASLTNDNSFANTVRLEWIPPFGEPVSGMPHAPGEQRVRRGAGEDALLLAPTAEHDLVDDPPAVSRDGDGLWRADSVDRWLPETVRLEPGETVRGDYWLVGHPEGSGRPTGVYEFARPDHRPLRVAVWETDRPGPAGDSRFAGASVPSLPGSASTAWYHRAGPTALSYLEPDRERLDLPAAVDVTFVNHGRESTVCGHWGVYKLVDGEWFDLGPHVHTADCRAVVSGGAERRTLRLRDDEVLPVDGEQTLSFGHLGAGRYAVTAGYGAETDRSAALLSVAAPSTTVTPTDDVERTRDGEVVTVTGPRHGRGDGDATLAVERVDGADRRVIPEQVMQRRGLRNTLPFFEDGVDRVLLRTVHGVVRRASGWGETPFRFRFRGTAFELVEVDDG